MNWSSDAIAEMLRRLEIEFIALVPGSSYRGLHDSIVNYLGNERPQILICLHEEHAVAIAHGYAKVAGRPMAAAVHANVGLMHATMAIYNAWCDRQPVLILGATGPVDAAKRRPWIDWIHTARDQGALVRPYVKWDEQPGSAQAAVDALARAVKLACEEPSGPVYLCFDVSMQEEPLSEPPHIPNLVRRGPAKAGGPNPTELDRAAEALRAARNPVILAGRVSGDDDDWQLRIALAEALNARVLTDLKVAAAFPTDHPLHDTPPIFFLSDAAKDVIREADVVLSLDWLDLGGTLSQVWTGAEVAATVISASLDERLANGWSYDHQAPADIDNDLGCGPDAAVRALCDRLGVTARPLPAAQPAASLEASQATGPINLRRLAETVALARQQREISLLRVPLGWPAEIYAFRGPLDYLGYDGGAGVGSGPGMAIGCALALRNSGRIPISILGDGDFLMGAMALWTAAHDNIPLLIVVANNRSYFNDELHQERVARHRGRPVENRWIGQRLDDPPINIPELARSMGLEAPGPVERVEDLPKALEGAISLVENGRPVVLDVVIDPGYADDTMSKS